jgi:hypothetical protein
MVNASKQFGTGEFDEKQTIPLFGRIRFIRNELNIERGRRKIDTPKQ